jgi:hypothetical protein
MRCPFAAVGGAFAACGSACASFTKRGLSFLAAALVLALAFRAEPAATAFRRSAALVFACAARLPSRDFAVFAT